MCFEGNDYQNSGAAWSCVTRTWHPLKRVKPRSKPDRVFQLNCGGVRTYASCETSSNNAFPFWRTMADYICSSSHFLHEENEYLKKNYLLLCTYYNNFPAGTQHSRNIRWVFLQRCKVPDIQGTFKEHFQGKYFQKK